MLDHTCQECEVEEMKELDKNSYIPNGGTALLDAIGESVMNLKARKGDEFDRNEATAVVVILTDGQENSAWVFKLDAIRNMICELEAGSNWMFSFSRATVVAIEVASSMNIRRQNSAQFNKSDIQGSIFGLGDSFADYAEEKSQVKKPNRFLKSLVGKKSKKPGII